MPSTPAEPQIWEAQGAEKRRAVQSMFADIAPTYDRLNAWMSARLHHRWRAYGVSLLRLRPGDQALDVCCGTGDFLSPLRTAVGKQGSVLGVDFCLPMLARVEGKTGELASLGDACALPIRSASVDAVTVGWGIRNVPDIDLAHREIARVLRPGGRFVSIDMARPRNPILRRLSEWVFLRLVPILGSLLGGSRKAYTYLPQSTQRFWTREMLVDSMEQAGFGNVLVKDLMFGNICVHFGEKR